MELTHRACRVLFALLGFLHGAFVQAVHQAAAQAESFGFVALNTSASSKCAAGPLNLSEVVAIHTWISSSVRGSIPPYYVDGVPVSVKYYARLGNPVAPTDCDVGTTKLDAATFQSGIKGMTSDNPAAPLASPEAIIRFVKDNGKLATVASASAFYSVQFHVYDWSCAMLATDKVLSTLGDLKGLDATSIARYLPCYRISGAVGVSYVDTNNKQQCACVRPVGTALNGASCTALASSNEGGGKCLWNTSRPSGYTCPWTNASASALKLISDCKVDVLVPSDNYGRVNKAVSILDTWQQFLLQPQLEVDGIEFRSFGVYNPCATATWGSKATDPTALTLLDLQTAVSKEASFLSFSSAKNVVNNGPSERVDIVTRTMKDWVEASYVAMTSASSACFHDYVVRHLLEQLVLTQSPLMLSSTALSSLQCMRCCSKQTTLREYYYDYTCGASSGPPSKLISGNETCAFNHCLRLTGSAPVQVSASPTANVMTPTDPMTISRSSPCPVLSSTCSNAATLSSLVNTSEAWSSALPNQNAYVAGYNVSAYVFWCYKKGTDDWVLWDDSAVLEFTSASTALVVQAWTRCRMVRQFDFKVAVSLLLTAIPSSTASRTPATISLNGTLLDLSKMPASCLSNEMMTGFKFSSSNGANAAYTSQCAALTAHLMDCGTAAINSFKLETNIESNKAIHGTSANYLDRQTVACPADSYLAKTQILNDTNNVNIWYRSTCCYYQRANVTRTSYGTMVPVSVAGMVTLPVSCLAGGGMNGFRLDYFSASYSVSCLADPRLLPGPQLYTNWVSNNGSIFSLVNHVMQQSTGQLPA
ncbi:hypothetical protein PHYSODRAFT_335177 [Phytophthora sojae]|uniref:Uncharacterized protein n=1 Tax=Phytophthora sojae (strain P6497) TaxID=1094619 RepID=G4ZUC6_PHYSP|nr:hypothetical protein PHYSODRAFT_335177 [Phytophthora sojae]EGZ13400.1 hypothetical protein PHYSODRAFT_335177 [Phytophthora sojae]|eukprot:XP_009530829.1 hypothetical protein PHYSODRAFT_335177 [Phytophthora sojae]